MKQLIKSVVTGVIGEKKTTALIRKLRGVPETFSEADLISEWFDAHPRTGVMVDVGAHFGESLAPYLQRGWQIQAFEPDPANRNKLLANVDASRIRLHHLAISDHEEAEVAFFASPESDGISSLSAFRDTHREVNRVRLRTLTNVLAEEKVERVDFLKIDTEGHDFFALKGFPWARLQPDVILCEFEDSKTLPLGYDYKQMGNYLRDLGYQVFLSEWAPIVRYGIQHTWRRWVPFPSDLLDAKGWGNLVAFRKGLPTNAAEKYVRRFQK